MKRTTQNTGFTMIEATIAMVILAIAAAGVLLPFANAASVQQEAARQTMAANLASELMEIILRDNYDDIISKYEIFEEDEGQMKDSDGHKRDDLADDEAAYTGYSRAASCQTVTVAGVDLIAVTVVVYYDNREMTRITTLVGDHE